MRTRSNLTILVVCVSACGGEGPSKGHSDSKLAEDATSKLEECALGVSEVDAQDAVIEDDYDRCAAQCVVDSSCAELRELRCSDSPDVNSDLVACVLACPEEPQDGFACENGSTIPHAAVCDSTEDCSDKSDEKGCPSYECADGEQLEVSDPTCDGFDDCADGSDEADCGGVCG